MNFPLFYFLATKLGVGHIQQYLSLVSFAEVPQMLWGTSAQNPIFQIQLSDKEIKSQEWGPKKSFFLEIVSFQ